MASPDAPQATSTRPKSLLWLALFAGATAVAAGLGAGATQRGRGVWYRALSKPAGQPRPQVFGPVWTTLYVLMSVAGKVDRPAAWLMTPYLGWLGYAGWLNLGIVRKNPRLAG